MRRISVVKKRQKFIEKMKSEKSSKIFFISARQSAEARITSPKSS